MRYSLLLALAAALSAPGAEKKLPEGGASNAALEIHARLHAEKADVQRLLGNDLQGYFTVVEVRLVPKGAGPLPVSREDFLLRSDKDGQRSGAFQPSQIAGGSVMVVATRRGGAIRSENQGAIWGPPMGGPPVRLGTEGPTIGNTAGEGSVEASTSRSGGDASVLKTLTEKELPEGELRQASSGLLYFMLEGKHKVKDLELQYRGPAGKLSLRFR
ncbi:MAG: hypothetical protein ACUVXB_04750 [Bryobacteraceae bacterium]